MTTESFFKGFFLVCGLVFLAGALDFKLSKPRGMYLPSPPNLQTARYWYYGMLPLGIGCLLSYVAALLDNRSLGLISFVGGGLLGTVFAGWKPRWVAPRWLMWLRDHYDRPVLEHMFEQAKQDKDWAKRVSTQEGLASWAKEMEEKLDRETE